MTSKEYTTMVRNFFWQGRSMSTGQGRKIEALIVRFAPEYDFDEIEILLKKFTEVFNISQHQSEELCAKIEEHGREFVLELVKHMKGFCDSRENG